MGTEIITFGETEIENHNFQRYKNPTLITY